MNETTAGAPAMPQQNAPTQDDSSIVSLALSIAAVNSANSGNGGNISGNSGGNGQSKGKKFKRGKETHVLPADAKVNTLAVKCYDEQLPYGVDYFIAAILREDPKETQVIAIRHYRDTVTDGIWFNPMVKPHWHVIVRLVDSKKRIRVLNMLHRLGIYFRPGIDDNLWLDHGVESIGNYAGYALYLTHETPDAIRDGKEKYEMDELVSNLTIDQIEDIRAGYIRVTAKKKLSPEDLAALDQEAYDLGCKLGDLSAWYDAQPFVVRSNAKIKVIRESYSRGVDARIKERQAINRLCVFIHGEKDSGKTYGAIEALGMKRVLTVRGGGTGKFDALRPDHNAIVIDDDVCPNLLNMSDNYICRAYKRQSNNPAWAGEYLIVTSNLTFDEWLTACGIGPRHTEAVRSRFYICEVRTLADGVRCLDLLKPSKRGTAEDQRARLDMFRKFRAGFDASIGEYSGSDRAVDYSEDLNSAKDRELELEFERYDELRTDALEAFSCWFWSSVSGGFADYLEQLPWELDNIDAGFDLSRDKSGLEAAVRACLPRFNQSRVRFGFAIRTWEGDRYYEPRKLVETFGMDMITNAVRFARDGGFGDIPPLTDDSGYRDWENRILVKLHRIGHKVCPDCQRYYPQGMRFCGCCGKPLPDKIFYGMPGFIFARIQRAEELGCSVDDISDEDVKDMPYVIQGDGKSA